MEDTALIDEVYVGIQFGRLVRTYRDVLHVLNTVLAAADFVNRNDLGRELEEIIRLWNSTAMLPFFQRAHDIIDELTDLMIETRYVDSVHFGTWLVPKETMHYVLISHEKTLMAALKPVEPQSPLEPTPAS